MVCRRWNWDVGEAGLETIGADDGLGDGLEAIFGEEESVVSGVIWGGLVGNRRVSGAAVKDCEKLLGKGGDDTLNLLDKEVNSGIGKVLV
jgi:hypothetical protein